jgi:hypothetical protein
MEDFASGRTWHGMTCRKKMQQMLKLKTLHDECRGVEGKAKAKSHVENDIHLFHVQATSPVFQHNSACVHMVSYSFALSLNKTAEIKKNAWSQCSCVCADENQKLCSLKSYMSFFVARCFIFVTLQAGLARKTRVLCYCLSPPRLDILFDLSS